VRVRVPQKLALVAFVAASAYIVWWMVHGAGQSSVDGSQPTSRLEVLTVSDGPEGAGAQTQDRRVSTMGGEPTNSYADQFDTAYDLLPFADAMHKRAVAGDDAAQYWLARVLERCGPIYDAVFEADGAQSDKPPLRLDEAVAAEEANPSLGADEIREIHLQCAQLRGVDRARYGNASDWLNRAARSGYPLAQVRRAAELALGSGGAPNRADARELVRAAVKSGDPEVLRQTGAVAQLLAEGESARERHEWVWEVAACQRGANCGPTAEWVRSLCALDRKCQPYEAAVDVIRRRVGAQLPEIEEEARQLNARIDAQKWDELGL
jgi:hypothetical protein